ncbi:MAG TPA: ABC transporter ATP-binding protein [Candidatus Dormibacteraeota bacterium]|nr:ABC transporter ATP-binding protein [Candidatus Dormibacteraeota bacterium]
MLLEIADLTKVYRRGVRANDGIMLSAAAGEVFGLLGHNGAGKTTLVNQVVGLLVPTSGTIRIDGRDAVADPGFARRACSIQPQAQVPIRGLTPRQAMELVGRMRGGRPADVRARTTWIAEALDLGEWLDTDAARVSGGVTRLVSFGMAIVAPGRIVILDEPTNDVDPVRRRLLWGLVRRIAEEGSAVLLVTHNVVEAERSVDRLAILDHGRVIAEGTPADLKAGLGSDLRLELVLEPGAPPPDLPPFLHRPAASAGRLAARLSPSDAGAAASWASELERGGAVEEFAIVPATLEDVYVELAGRPDALTRDGRASTGEKEALDVVGA